MILAALRSVLASTWFWLALALASAGVMGRLWLHERDAFAQYRGAVDALNLAAQGRTRARIAADRLKRNCPMRNTLPLLVLGLLLLTACAARPVQSVLSCPPPPPVPATLSGPVSTGPSLSQDFEASWKIFEARLVELLKRATVSD